MCKRIIRDKTPNYAVLQMITDETVQVSTALLTPEVSLLLEILTFKYFFPINFNLYPNPKGNSTSYGKLKPRFSFKIVFLYLFNEVL